MKALQWISDYMDLATAEQKTRIEVLKSKVITTVPAMQQFYDVLWAEIAKWLDSSNVKNLLTWTKTKVYMNGDSERWFATAKTATKPDRGRIF